MDVSAMPASTMVRREAPAYNDTKNTSNAEASAPKNAPAADTPSACGATHANSKTNKPDPALTPMMFELASGLFNVAWMSAPASASAAPASTPPRTRGTRTFASTFTAMSDALPVAYATTSLAPIDDDPSARPANTTPARAKSKTSSMVPKRCRAQSVIATVLSRSLRTNQPIRRTAHRTGLDTLDPTEHLACTGTTADQASPHDRSSPHQAVPMPGSASSARPALAAPTRPNYP